MGFGAQRLRMKRQLSAPPRVDSGDPMDDELGPGRNCCSERTGTLHARDRMASIHCQGRGCQHEGAACEQGAGVLGKNLIHSHLGWSLVIWFLLSLVVIFSVTSQSLSREDPLEMGS